VLSYRRLQSLPGKIESQARRVHIAIVSGLIFVEVAKPEKVAFVWSSRKVAKSESKVEGGLRGYDCYKTGPILIGGLSETDAKGRQA